MRLSSAQRRGLDGKAAILRHIDRTGRTIAGDLVWSEREISNLRGIYPNKTALAATLPGRTQAAFRQKARQLGLVRPLRIWTYQDAMRLRKPYVTGVPIGQLTGLFPGKTSKQIWRKAAHLGFRRPRRAPLPTGVLLVDSIRQRAYDLRLSMTDLDRCLGTKRYFVSPRYVNWRALQLAVEILGGRPMVRWHDELVSLG